METPPPQHYDFIEIGTCDFNTVCARAPETQRGIAVEPMIQYLNRLPDKPLLTKINAAVSDTDGVCDIFYISPSDITEYGLPSSARGCNSIGRPHPTVVRWLTERGLPLDLIKTIPVPIISITTLLENYGVGSIGLLKIDTEGHDCVILSAFLDYIEERPHLRPRRILYESNSLTSLSERRAMAQRLSSFGYTVSYDSRDTNAILNLT